LFGHLLLYVLATVGVFPGHDQLCCAAAGAMACMLTSSLCHLFGCCAAHVTRIMWRFDYAGIAVLIVTSFYPAVYYGFLCYPWLRFAYLLTTTLLGE
jgi:adiponectin receptor